MAYEKTYGSMTRSTPSSSGNGHGKKMPNGMITGIQAKNSCRVVPPNLEKHISSSYMRSGHEAPNQVQFKKY